MKAKQPPTWKRSDPSAKPAYVRAMFARIVPRYDLVNTLMTCGLDRRWRALTARLAQPQGTTVLDAATGTGDLALELLRQGASRVVAADFCPEMLTAAEGKAGASATAARLMLAAADVQRLPFASASFDRVVNGFLLRNVGDLRATFSEFHRVLRPGGLLVCLDLTRPPALLRPLMWPHINLIVPLLGGLVSGDFAAYRYLPASVGVHPDARAICAMLAEAGFAEADFVRVGTGTIAIHTARKPAPTAHGDS